MNKKFTLFILAFYCFLLNAQVPTCSLDPVFIAMPKYGVWPDSATNFMSGTVGVPYIQNITVKVPLDTITQLGKLCFNRVVVTTPTSAVNYNLPPGLNFGSSTSVVNNGTVNGAPSLKFPGNANNCASIYGTPTVAGSYTLALKVDTYATLSFGTCPASPNVNGGVNFNTTYLNYYIINISPTAGINEIASKSFFNLKAEPNPSAAKTTLSFHSNVNKKAIIVIRDMIGKEVYHKEVETQAGTNEYTLEASQLSSGVFFCTLLLDNYSETIRLVRLSN